MIFVEHYLNSDQISKAKKYLRKTKFNAYGVTIKAVTKTTLKKLWPIVVLNHWIEKNRVTI